MEKESFLDTMHAKIGEFIDDLADRLQEDGEDWTPLEIATQTFDAMQGAIARQKLAAYPPDVTIVIPRNVCTTLEFDRADEMIALGRAAAAAQMKRQESA